MRTTTIRAAFAAATFVSAAFAADVNWIGGSGGTEAEPLDLYNAANWSNNALPSTSNRYNLSVDAPSVFIDSAPAGTSIADWFKPYQGDFTFIGPMKVNCFGYGSSSGRVTITKKGDWIVPWDSQFAPAANAYMLFKNVSGDWTQDNNSGVSIANGSSSTAIIEKDAGDWSFRGWVDLASGSSSTAEFYNRGGALTFKNNFNIARNSSATKAYFEISGGAVTNTAGYIQLGHYGRGTMTVKRGGSYTRIGEQDGGSIWMSMEDNASGTLNVEGGEVLLGGTLGIHYRGSNGDTAINVTDGGILTMSRIYQRTSGSAVNVLVDNGTLRAYTDRTDFLPDASYLTVKVGNGGATFDADSHAITIAKEIIDDDGESGPVTFAGDGGTIRLTGALSATGAINLNEKTHLIVADASMKSAILSRGITVLKPRRGSAKGTFTLFSVADGTQCTTADLSSITLGSGLTGATLSIVDGAITIEVSHSTQTWSGPAGTSAPWSGLNWDDGEAFDDGNDALFATANAIAEVDAAVDAFTLTFNENATLTGSGTLTVPVVSVVPDVSATISAPTAGLLEKTGAGSLTLGASRSAQTTLSEGTLVMTSGATLNGVTLGTDPAKPLTLDLGGGSLSANPVNMMGSNCDLTLRNATLPNSGLNIANGKTLRLGPGVKITLTGFCELGGNSCFEIDGCAVTNTAGYVQIGKDSVSTMTVKNGGSFTRIGEQDGGSLWMSMNDNGSGTLNVQGGDMLLGGALGIHYRGSNGSTAINVTDGGVLTMSRMYQRSGSTAVNVLIDDGTLRAYADNTAYIPNQSYITVTVGEGGGAIDANGKKITIAKQLSGAGGVTYKGGGVVTLSAAPAYSGKTTVEVGTCLVVPSAIAGENLAFAIPAGLADGVYEVATVSGGSFAADVLSTATLPENANARFRLGPGNKTIYCIYGDASEQFWVGGASGNLNVAANWLCGYVPTSGEAVIGNATAATLANGAGFTPDTITFPANTAKITINGDSITFVTTFINHSSSTNEFACPVSGSAITFDNDAASCRFSGGITVETPTFAKRSGGKSDLLGTWRITASTWTPLSGYCIYSGDSVTVDGELLDPNNVNIYAGGTLTAASMRATSSTYPAWTNEGRFIVTGDMDIANTSKDFFLARQDAQNATLIVGGLVFNTGRYAWLNAKTLVVGEGGIRFGSSNNELRFSNSATLYSRDGTLTLGGAQSGITKRYSIDRGQNVTFDTTKYGTADVPATFNIDGVIRVNSTDGYTGGMVVKGCGKVVFNSVSTFAGGLAVSNSATVAVNAGMQPGGGAVTLSDASTLEVAQSGTATLGGALTVGSDATLAFSFTEKRVAPVLSGTSVTVSGDAVKVKLSSADGLDMNGGVYTLTSGLDFSGKTLNLVDKPKWVKSAEVDGSGNIVLTVLNRGLVIYVK